MDLTENPYHGQPRLFPGEITDSEGFSRRPQIPKKTQIQTQNKQ